MLLRSASTPVLSSWNKAHGKGPLESEFKHCLLQQKKPRTTKPIISLTASLSPLTRSVPRAVSDLDLVQLYGCKVGSLRESQSQVLMGKESETEFGRGGFCGGGGDSGGGCCGGGSGSVNEYYLKMIEANPGNTSILCNYAMFLKEIRGDYAEAEEYSERAMLASPDDGTVLSICADLLWKNQRDAGRAESYFDQAVNSAPHDCYVMASYAHFLWDVEDEKIEDKEGMNMAETSNPGFFRRECLAAPS